MTLSFRGHLISFYCHRCGGNIIDPNGKRTWLLLCSLQLEEQFPNSTNYLSHKFIVANEPQKSDYSKIVPNTVLTNGVYPKQNKTKPNKTPLKVHMNACNICPPEGNVGISPFLLLGIFHGLRNPSM